MAALVEALPRLAAAPGDRDARARALYGAWLCGAALGGTTMALHHKLCHVLGGSFGLPHAETHAVMLPHAVGLQRRGGRGAPRAGERGAGRGARRDGGSTTLAGRIGAPRALRELGLAEGDLDRAAEIAAEDPYWNPRPVERDGVRALLAAAWAGEPPA